MTLLRTNPSDRSVTLMLYLNTKLGGEIASHGFKSKATYFGLDSVQIGSLPGEELTKSGYHWKTV
jgi:hypothetical protein